ncbi:uncharacterized protein CG10915 isoform X2 [Cimex lectularius]|uniref:Cortactin-binding protein-2 N-terminal domain-containing protein n=1 Tax=Cimex lectularius TaxID=79782 RepID=A0A8I6TCY7_CIMLE|nr:uncharacterized protein CG10915 isoform X2 [Cimex lectularius]
MASNVNLTKNICLNAKQNEEGIHIANYEPLDKTCNTLKRNPKMELSKADLLKLLSYLEGELQARDIVIATLKCEKMKYMLNQGQYKSSLSDPLSALHRDGFAAPSHSLDQTEMNIAEHQRNYLENLVLQHRKAQIRMANILKDAELHHRKVIEELIMEKKKHEHDTAQGDDITYGLEKERTRLKQDLEMERQAKKKLEKDLKKISDVSDEDKSRQKQIVLLLLADRKKIVMKYIEERKRSEDLAQILSEEKSRIDSMAEGLEEESKKSLQMEAELEKQLALFDTESQILRSNLLREEKRVKELEAELEKTQNEVAMLEKQLAEIHQLAVQGWPEGNSTLPLQTNTAMSSSVAKVVQPTATVSSVPVSGPTTGVARSISPGHGLRSVPYSHLQSTLPAKVEKRLIGNNVLPANTKPNVPLNPKTSHTLASANGNPDKKQPLSRGVPPPIPPNKPVVPPKKDSVLIGRRTDINTPVNMDISKYKEAKSQLAVEGQDQQADIDPGETYQNLPSSSQSGVV